jgi:hypothetical protein
LRAFLELDATELTLVADAFGQACVELEPQEAATISALEQNAALDGMTHSEFQTLAGHCRALLPLRPAQNALETDSVLTQVAIAVAAIK